MIFGEFLKYNALNIANKYLVAFLLLIYHPKDKWCWPVDEVFFQLPGDSFINRHFVFSVSET